MTFRNTARVPLLAAALIAAGLLRAVPTPAAPLREIALVDFTVHAEERRAPEHAWLGPAISELLQAKMRLFEGVRVLERSRLRALLKDAGSFPSEGDDPPGNLFAFLPAELLVAGSVAVAPGDGPARIRVQARAFDIATSRILSEASFSVVTELAGLLALAEDLARQFAEGLGISYTAEQLSYAEPAGIDSLRSFVAGTGHLDAGRHREAIDAFQDALDGNGGLYYPAAHRAQGEAFRELADTAEGRESAEIRRVYLEKFQEDAVVASGALFDLGMAYEANGMWEKAIETYRDYEAAVGPEGRAIFWSLGPRDLRKKFISEIHPVMDEKEDVHLFTNVSRYPMLYQLYHWITIDARTGEVLRDVPFTEEIGLFPKECNPMVLNDGRARYRSGVFDLWEGRALLWGEATSSEDGGAACPYVAAVSQEGHLLWKTDLGGKGASHLTVRSRLEDRDTRAVHHHRGLIFVHLNNREWSHDSDRVLVTIDADNGDILSRVVTRQGEPLMRLDLARGRWLAERGAWELATGDFFPETMTVPPATPEGEDQRPKPFYFAGSPGATYRRESEGTRFFQYGREQLFVEEFFPYPYLQIPLGVSQGPFVLIDNSGSFALVNTDDWSILTLYGDYRGVSPSKTRVYPSLIAKGNSYFAFILDVDPKKGITDPKYGLPMMKPARVLNVIDHSTGHLVAKYPLPAGRRKPMPWDQRPQERLSVTFIGDDMLVALGNRISRVDLPRRGRLDIILTTEIALRIASCLVALGDGASAARQISLFEQGHPGDPRGGMIRMKIAALEGDRIEAARLALEISGAGGVREDELDEYLQVIRKAYPEVRDAIATPFKGQVLLHSVSENGMLVGTYRTEGSSPDLYRPVDVHILIDTESKESTIVKTPGIMKGRYPKHRYPSYFGTNVYGIGKDIRHFLRYQLLNGTKVESGKVPHFLKKFHPELEGALIGRIPGSNENAISIFDPKSLVQEDSFPLDEHQRQVFLGNGMIVFAQLEYMPSPYTLKEWESPLFVLDLERREEVKRLDLALKKEKIVTAVADAEQLVVAVRGDDREKLDNWGLAAWMRIESFPLNDTGRRWSYWKEGVPAGNLVIDGETVSFPAYPGKYPESTATRNSKFINYFPPYSPSGPLYDEMPLQKITLDRRSGAEKSVSRLLFSPWSMDRKKKPPDAARVNMSRSDLEEANRLFSPEILGEYQPFKYIPSLEYWFYSANYPPATVFSGSPEKKYRLVFERDARLYSGGFVMSLNDTVFESIGGGVVLVKDLAEGRGMQRLSTK